MTGRVISPQTAELDHVVPISRGGSLTIENLRWLCAEANQAKRAMLDDEFIRLCTEVTEFIGRQIMKAINLGNEQTKEE